MKPLNPDEPRQVGRYRLVAALGEGGMGRVLLGVSPDGRLVAVKQVQRWPPWPPSPERPWPPSRRTATGRTPAPRPTAFSPADLRQINPEKFTASVLANLPPVR